MTKHVIKDKVKAWRQTIFRVAAVAKSEQEILVHFGRRVSYQVVKLDVKDLPPTDFDKKKIRWINNFAVVPSGHSLGKMHYTVFLPALPKGSSFVYYEHGRLKHDKFPKSAGTKWPRSHMVQVDFDSGDPGIGCRDAKKPVD